jgi:uncharacterized membrane protein YvbJ
MQNKCPACGGKLDTEFTCIQCGGRYPPGWLTGRAENNETLESRTVLSPSGRVVPQGLEAPEGS